MTVVRLLCAVLFCLFVSFYLYFLQGELLARAQYVYSKGLTSYSLAWGAVIIPLVLQIVQCVVARMSHLPIRVHAFSYIPSMLMLTMLVSVNESVMADFSLRSWVWIAPVVLFVYVLIVVVSRRLTEVYSKNVSYALSEVIWTNAFILLGTMILCGSFSNAADVYHYELKTERLILERNYVAATKVADRELQTSPRLTRLRMFALSKQGLLGERLFDYPQYYDGAGLLDIADADTTQRLRQYAIYQHIGAAPNAATVHSSLRFLELVNADDSLRTQVSKDYHLCYLLLERRLSDFISLLPDYYPQGSCLPRAYSEAVVYAQVGDSLLDLDYEISEEVRGRYWQYASRMQELADPVERVNRMRREFGNTFWWYYDFKVRNATNTY